MRNLLMTAAAAICLVALSATAGEDGKQGPTPEQKEFRKKMVEKYDTNGDGKIDKEERAKMSAEDQQKMKEMRGGQGKKPKKGGDE